MGKEISVPKPKRNLSSRSIASGNKRSTGRHAVLKQNIFCCDKGFFGYIPIKTVSEANKSEHWGAKSKRHARQKEIITLLLKAYKDQMPLPCKITLIRYSPKLLDKHDNLPMSFKYILDGICEVITGNLTPGAADSDERITVSYDQCQQKEYGISIFIEKV